MTELSRDPRWLLLIHQIPPKPAYFRVKIWRRLQAMGAVAIKNSVYVAPRTDDTQEEAAEGLLAGLEARLRRRGAGGSSVIADRERIEDLRGRTWVTRKGIHIDRIASAWLIRRVVDSDARFKFVAGKGYRPEHGELRFDMFEAEFTHEGDLCTFEVLRARLAIDDPAMRPIAEIVHDIDLKDGKFGRPEGAGIDRLIAGIAMGHRDDESRLERGSAVFDDLYAYFSRRRG